MKKQTLSVIFVKTLLAVLLFAGIGTIIFGGGCIIWEYSKNKVSNQTVKPVEQEENYYDVLEKKCNGKSCCLASFKYMKENNYKEADKDYKCPDGFKAGGIRCESSLSWCEPMEEIDWKSCNQDSDCVETRADCCNCNNGGEQIGINKKYLNSWEDTLKYKCYNIGCIALFNCKEGSVICENDKCEFKQEINNNDDQLDTSDWQTYRNEEFGFELKYPDYVSDINRFGKKPLGEKSRIQLTFSGFGSNNSNTNHTYNCRLFIRDKNSINATSIINRLEKYDWENHFVPKRIDGLNVEMIQKDGYGTIDYYFVNVYFVDDNYLYDFEISGEKYKKDIINDFEKILSTFKFIEKEEIK